MSLASVVSAGVRIAKNITDGGRLLTTVQWSAWIKQDGHGTDSFAAPVALKAFVERSQQGFPSRDGQMEVCNSKVTILEPLPVNGAPGRVEPLDSRDQIVLPDGTTNTILAIKGAVNGETGQPYYFEVYL